MDNNVLTRIKYEGNVFVELHFGGEDARDVPGCLFHRTDYHEDGSQSEYWGIELIESHYIAVKEDQEAQRALEAMPK